MSHKIFPTDTIDRFDDDVADDAVTDFVAAARDLPDGTAIVHNGTTITYRDLADRVRGTAAQYRTGAPLTSGVPGRIGVLATHTPALVVHLLGILHAGGTYCPIDAALPDRRQYALTAALGVNRLCTTNESPHTPTAADAVLPHPLCDPSDPAYALCTSGSTGKPKPVVVSRGALTVTTRALRELFAITPTDRVLQFASLGWDTCFEEILPTLTGGATLVFDDAAHSGSFPPFVRMLTQRRITVLDLPTAFWHELVLFLHEAQTGLPDCVRLVVIGGERVDPTRLRQWRALDLGQVRLLNTYGCTETTMVTHAVQLHGPGTEPEVTAGGAEAPLGRPLPHVRDHVTVEGELLVSGPALATGYLGLAEPTATAFPVADHGCGPARWFRTGDLVTRGEHGLLYGRGRVDEQVKIRGVRVHPAEVEARLNSHPAVTSAVVVGEHLLGRMSLTAYVVKAGPTTSAELKQYLRDHLPGQFVPNRVTFVAALAYTPSGKVDRAATRRAAAHHDRQGVDR